MENKKTTNSFKNFCYEVMPKISEGFTDVNVKFNFNGKEAEHVVSFATAKNKGNDYYIARAKDKINHLIEDGKLAKYAKKYIKNHATFYGRHKKPILAISSVVVAGAVAAAIACSVIYLAKDPTKVTEEEIDEHLRLPQGDLTPVSDKVIAEIEDSLQTTLTNSLLNAEIKRIADYNSIKVDPYNEAREVSKKTSKNANRQGMISFKKNSYNDTTGYYTDPAKATKRLNSTYTRVDVAHSPTTLHTMTKNSYEMLSGGVTSTNQVNSEVYYTYKQKAKNFWPIFEHCEVEYDGYKASNLNTEAIIDGAPTSEFEAKTAMDELALRQVSDIADFRNLKKFVSEQSSGYVRQLDENNIYCFPIPQKQYYFVDEWGVKCPCPYMPSTYIEEGIPTYSYNTEIWHFTKDAKYGWILADYAVDESLYVEYNDKGELLNKPFAVNKRKGFITFNYGNRPFATGIEYLVPPDEPSYAQYMIPLTFHSYDYDETGDIEPGYSSPLPDMTLSARKMDKTFEGYKLGYPRYEAYANEAFYIDAWSSEGYVDYNTLTETPSSEYVGVTEEEDIVFLKDGIYSIELEYEKGSTDFTKPSKFTVNYVGAY